MTDFLGRHQVETDVDSIAHYVTGKRVLGDWGRRVDRLGVVSPTA
ncbi:MAG: hypothetical protein V9G13_10935 [Marmoricola sp.]